MLVSAAILNIETSTFGILGAHSLADTASWRGWTRVGTRRLHSSQARAAVGQHSTCALRFRGGVAAALGQQSAKLSATRTHKVDCHNCCP